jgi:hypothetical protein
VAETVLLEVRERRSRFGRVVRWGFWIFQAVMLLTALGTCAFVGPSLTNPDPEVAIGAGMFGAAALGTIWTVWPVGTLVLGLLLLFTRGRKRLIQDPASLAAAAAPSPPPAPAAAPPAAAPHRPGGSVPPTGGGG